MPEFTTNYFQHAENAWRHFFFKMANWDPQRPRVAVEVGSYEGTSALWMMQNLLLAPESRLFCIDAWIGEGGEERRERFLRNIDELPNRSQIEVYQGWSQDGLREFLRRGVRADLLYVDGGHDAPTVLRDLVTGFDLVKPYGVIICDDYLWADPQYGGNRTLGRPKIAIDAFTTIYADKLKIISGLPNNQVYIQKVAD